MRLSKSRKSSLNISINFLSDTLDCFLDIFTSSALLFSLDLPVSVDFFTSVISPTIFPFLIYGFVSSSSVMMLSFCVFTSRLYLGFSIIMIKAQNQAWPLGFPLFYEIFEQSAVFIAEEYNFTFPIIKASKVISFLNHVRDLPEDADSIY